MGWIDDEGEWHPFPPLPLWDPTPIRPGERIPVWDGQRYRSRRAVPEPCPLFRSAREDHGQESVRG